MFALLLALSVLPASEAGKLVQPGQPSVVHFFANWCGPCHAEFPRLRKTLLALPSRGVKVRLVAIDQPDQLRAEEQMLAGFRLQSLPAVLLDAPSPDPVIAAIGDRKWDGTLPATFLFDAQGKLVKGFRGVASPAKLKKAIDALLGAPGGGL